MRFERNKALRWGPFLLVTALELVALLLINRFVNTDSWLAVAIMFVAALIFILVLMLTANRVSRNHESSP